jgi:Icc protein
MQRQKQDLSLHNHNDDGVDRRGFLKCMAWAGTGALLVMKGGILRSYSLSDPSSLAGAAGGELSFIQISDSHMGFDKAANPDVVATLKVAVDRINAAPIQPEFLLHTGDITHLSKPGEFDTVDQVLKGAKASLVQLR